jgi:hypothetical protein
MHGRRLLATCAVSLVLDAGAIRPGAGRGPDGELQ